MIGARSRSRIGLEEPGEERVVSIERGPQRCRQRRPGEVRQRREQGIAGVPRTTTSACMPGFKPASFLRLRQSRPHLSTTEAAASRVRSSPRTPRPPRALTSSRRAAGVTGRDRVGRPKTTTRSDLLGQASRTAAADTWTRRLRPTARCSTARQSSGTAASSGKIQRCWRAVSGRQSPATITVWMPSESVIGSAGASDDVITSSGAGGGEANLRRHQRLAELDIQLHRTGHPRPGPGGCRHDPGHLETPGAMIRSLI